MVLFYGVYDWTNWFGQRASTTVCAALERTIVKQRYADAS
jgi:hypothetical protein